MDESGRPRDPSLNPATEPLLARKRQLEDILDAFEAAWQAGSQPDWSAYVPESAQLRSLAVPELIRLDWHYRSEAGQTPRPEDYFERLAELKPGYWNEHLAELERVTQPVAQGSTLGLDGDSQTNGDRRGEVGSTPTHCGEYELIEEIARGGMGVVYKAQDRRLGRLAAVKMILSAELASREQVRRFYAEAEAAAQLDHPCIVPVFEVGEQAGQHYLAMAYVPGQSLWQQVKDQPLAPRRAAEIMRQVAEAVEHAHQRGILHRDLKPHNILMTETGQPRVADFGLAKRMETDSSLTATGQVMGTPSYMPPEQATGRHQELDRRSDVYALGATLYCLLTGRPPFQAATIGETLWLVCQEEPVSPRLVNPSIARDLETLCLKCLQKEPGQRYPSAAALAADLQRFLGGEPIVARPIGRLEHAWRWTRRNRLVAGLMLLVLVALVGGTAFSTYFAIRSSQQATAARDSAARALSSEELARNNAATAQANELLAANHARRAETNERLALEQTEIANQRAHAARASAYVASIQAATSAHREGESELALKLLHDLIPADDAEDLRGPEWYLAWAAANKRLPALNDQHSIIFSLAISPDGELAATAQGHGVILWRTDTGEAVHLLDGQQGAVFSVAFSADGSQVATGGMDRVVRLWDCQTGALIRIVGRHEVPVTALAFSPEGRWLVSGGGEVRKSGLMKVWNLATNELEIAIKVPGHTARHLHFGAGGITFGDEGRVLATAAMDGYVRTFDTSTWQQLAEQPSPALTRAWAVAISPDSELVVSSYTDKTAHMWDRHTLEPLGVIQGHIGTPSSLSFSPDGQWLAMAGNDAVLYNLKTKEIRGVAKQVNRVVYHPRGDRLLVTGTLGQVRQSRIETSDHQLLRHESGGAVHAVRVHDDGHRMLVLQTKQWALWDLDTGTARQSEPLGDVSWTTLLPAPGGESAFRLVHQAATDEDNPPAAGIVEWFDPFTHEVLGQFAGARRMACSRNRRILVAGDPEDSLSVLVWDLTTGQQVTALRNFSDKVTGLATSDDGRFVVVECDDGAVAWVDLAEGTRQLTAHRVVEGRVRRGWEEGASGTLRRQPNHKEF